MWMSLKISRKDETATILKVFVGVDPLSIMLQCRYLQREANAALTGAI